MRVRAVANESQATGTREDGASPIVVVETVAAARRACLRARMAAFGPDRLGLIVVHRALHEGHLGLIRQAREECGVVTVFLDQTGNPASAVHDDVLSGPDLDPDIARLVAAGADVVFRPRAGALLDGVSTRIIHQEQGPGLLPPEKLTAFVKLLQICGPEKLYFGQLDGLPFAHLRRSLRDLAITTELVACPTAHDADGLPLGAPALGNGERRSALAIPRALDAMQQAITDGSRDREAVLRVGSSVLKRHPELKLEYLEAFHPDTLERVARLVPGTLVGLGARIGKVTITDSFVVE